MSKSEVNVMCDLETLGTRPGCVILSIAAVPFCINETIHSFYERIDKHSYPTGFHVDPATLRWWELQSEEARTEAFSGIRHINNVLEDFGRWCKALPGEVLLWGNGANFDNVLLAEAHAKLSLTAPWKFYNDRCYRTLKNLYPHIAYIKPKVAHNALSDAEAQAFHAETILNSLRR